MKPNGTFPNIENCDPRACYSGRIMKYNRIIAKLFRKHLMPLGITDSQLSILFVVTKGSEINQKKLSDILFLEKSTTNRNLKRLIEKGYIAKDTFYYTTQLGSEFLEIAIPQWNLAMQEVKDIIGTDGDKAFDTLSSILIDKKD